jgi:two-component system chemotaxis sensor kinase CheA
MSLVNSFVEKFREEVKEYLERIESGLLVLEKDHTNQQVIDEVFRIMHSLKGSGGMFGFDLLSDVTHDLESLYDIFRSNKGTIDSEVINFTLQSIDGLHHLMVQEPEEEHRLMAQKMKADTQVQISRFKSESTGIPDEKILVQKKINTEEVSKTIYFISFDPSETIFINGTNPLYLIDELNALGECNILVSFDRLPELSAIDPEKCYVSWNVFIATTESEDTLKDVFIFVADNARIKIEKVKSGSLIHNEKVMADYLNSLSNKEFSIPNQSESTEIEQTIEVVSESDIDESPSALEPGKETPVNVPFSQTKVDSIKVDSQKIDHYMNLISELITAQYHLEEISKRLKDQELGQVTENFSKLGRQLRENAFDMSLIPLQSVTVRFNRLIHDLSKSLEKDVVLVTEGMETELDKNIIEKLLEPLLHIIRNSMDHGIENKAERLKKGKAPTGTISIKATTVGSYVQIEIEDDGAGIDSEQVKAKAIANGILSGNSTESEDELYQLIFEPGFSTSSLVTDVSGRGVGMDVVKKRVMEMRGSVELATEKDKFTRFTIKLPLSLSIIDGLLTTVGNSFYVIPTSVIRKIYQIKSKLLKKGFRQVIELEGNQVPYLNMHEEFENQNHLPADQFVVCVFFDNQLFGLVVDEVIREYQAVIKPLGRLLKGQDIFSGASILGTGQLALVIDTNKMIKKYS